jgi:ATP-dependent RNA helicase SUPV3L1/SUV3
MSPLPRSRKFDGYQYRDLTAAELGQIAGRAGRHVRDGTFGVTGQVPPLSEDLIEKIESHDFEPVRVLQWRTPDFDFSSVDALRRSIETVPVVEGLTKALPAIDQRALEQLAGDPAIRALANNRQRVALLWDACALPDYRRIAPAQHADLIGSIFQDLAERGHVDEAYMAEQVRRADTTDGDIDTLSQRIAQIRTWTFVSHRPGWLADPTHWQGKTREIEDRLSDALHERLTKRFVDRRTSVLMRRLRENSMLEAEISPNGAVIVEGHHVGELQGFRFTADASAGGEDGKAVRAAAQKALAAEFESRAEKFSTAPNGDFALAHDGIMRWLGQPVATLTDTDDILKPRAILLADEQLTGPARDKVAERLERYVGYQIDSQLKPLVDLKNADQLTGIARGVAFRLIENLGLIDRREIADDIKSLDQESRAALRRLGVRFGAYHIFLPALLKPAPANLLTLLWALKNDGKDKPGFGDVVHSLAAGRTSVVVDQSFDKAFYKLAGYRILGRRAVRVDILERLADLIRPALSWKPGAGPRPDGGYDGGAFMVTPQMMSILGASPSDMEEILKGLGYRGEPKLPAEIAKRIADVDQRAEAQKAAQQAAQAAAAASAVEASEEQAASDEAAAEEITETELSSLVETSVNIPAELVPDAAVSAAIAIAPVTPDDAAEAEEAAAAEEPGTQAGSPVAADAVAPVAVAITAETLAGDAPVAVQAPAAGIEEPKPVMIWRPESQRRQPPPWPRSAARRPAPPPAGRPNRASSRPQRRPAQRRQSPRQSEA